MSDDICLVKKINSGVSVVDGAGVKLNRIIASHRLNFIDPFVLLDEFKSDNPEDYIRGFPTHPHRGIETITYMKKGTFEHKDSKGGGGLLSDGCVQWMTAGRGILHSEMPGQDKGELWGYQLWLSLAAKDKMVEPRYQHLNPEDIPTVEKEGLRVNIISGSYDGVNGPAKNWVESSYFEVILEKDSVFKLDIDEKMNSCIYVHTGSVIAAPSVEPKMIKKREIAEFENNHIIEIKGEADESGFLFLAGIPNNEPIARGGPFVMNTEKEIEQAFIDYHNGVLHI